MSIFPLAEDCQKYLRRLSYEQSIERGRRVTISSLAIDALEEKYVNNIPENRLLVVK